MKVPFIDIHTHHPCNSEEVIAVQSLFLQDIDFNDEIDFPFSAAIHPWHAQRFNINEASLILEKLIVQKKLIAIGETGLDKVCTACFQLQKKLFELHLDFAEAHHLPLIIHSVKAWNDLISSLKHAKTPCILHGYSEGITLTKELIDLGCYFSFGKSLFQISPRIQEAIQIIPFTSLFLETDESTVPIEEIYQQMAKTVDLSVNTLKSQIDKNFNTLFPGYTDSRQFNRELLSRKERNHEES